MPSEIRRPRPVPPAPAGSYEALSGAARLAARRLELLRGQEFSAWVPAALLDRPEAAAEEVLAELVGAGLVGVTGADRTGRRRYRACSPGPEGSAGEDRDDTRAAVRRLGTAWLDRIVQVARRAFGPPLLPPARRDVLRGAADPVVQAAPMEWFAAERAGLLSAVELLRDWELGQECWLLVHCAHEVLESNASPADWERACEIGLAAARAAGDQVGAGYMHYGLATAAIMTDHDAATALGRRAGGLLFAAGDRWGAAVVSGSMAEVAAIFAVPGWPAALSRAIAGLHRIGEHSWAATVESVLAQFAEPAGAATVARHERALRLQRADGAHRRAAIVARRLAGAYEQAGQPERAEAVLADVMAWCVDVGDLRGTARVHIDLSRLRGRRGDVPAAERHLADAVEASRRAHDDLARNLALTQWGRLRIRQGRPREAARSLDEACIGLRALHATRYLEQAERLRSSCPA